MIDTRWYYNIIILEIWFSHRNGIIDSNKDLEKGYSIKVSNFDDNGMFYRYQRKLPHDCLLNYYNFLKTLTNDKLSIGRLIYKNGLYEHYVRF